MAIKISTLFQITKPFLNQNIMCNVGYERAILRLNKMGCRMALSFEVK